MILDKDGYIMRRTRSSGGNIGQSASYRNWFFVNQRNASTVGVQLGPLTLPKEYAGKRVRFKIEFVEEKKGNI